MPRQLSRCQTLPAVLLHLLLTFIFTAVREDWLLGDHTCLSNSTSQRSDTQLDLQHNNNYTVSKASEGLLCFLDG